MKYVDVFKNIVILCLQLNEDYLHITFNFLCSYL